MFKEEIVKAIAKCVTFEGIDKYLEVPKDPLLGDFAFPCFLLAKELKKSPNMIAEDLAKQIEPNDFIEKIEAKGPYLNFFLKKSAFIKKVVPTYTLSVSTGEFKLTGGTVNLIVNRNEKVVVEYMNANPNKPLHIGQARNICIGDTIIRAYRYLGYQTDGINYGDDSGVNVGYNIVAHLYYNYPLTSEKKFDHYCGDIYTEMRKNDSDEEFKVRLSKTLLDIEHGTDEKLIELHQNYTKKCAIAQFESCWRLNAFFDLVNWETDILYLKFFEKTIEKLKETKQIKIMEEGELKGCLVLDLSELPEYKNLKNPYQVLIKSDKVATYTAKDIVYSMWKLGYLKEDFFYKKLVRQPNGKITFTTTSKPENSEKTNFGNYDTAIAVIDNRQSHPQSIVKTCLNMLGYINEKKRYLHLAYGVVYLTPRTLIGFEFELTDEEKKEERLPFSSRKGWFITIDETFDKLKSKAFNESKKRNPDKSDEWLNDVAEKIALASFRFFLTKYDVNRDITFDIDDALDMEGETGAYVLYSYARISNIFAKVENLSGILTSANSDLLTENMEFQISKKIIELDSVVEQVRLQLSPNLLCRYVLDLCQMFNSYYAHVPVLKSEESVRNARLALLKKLQETMKSAMNILGLIEIERM